MARGATVKLADLTVEDGLDKLKRRGPFFFGHSNFELVFECFVAFTVLLKW